MCDDEGVVANDRDEARKEQARMEPSDWVKINGRWYRVEDVPHPGDV